MLSGQRRILVLAPHTDDGEFGAGASMSKWIREGHEIYYVAFSGCQASVPKGWPPDILSRELREAAAVIGIPPDNVRILDFKVRNFASVRQDILDTLVSIKGELNPDLVLMPSVEDLHQDHYTVAMEGLRAFKTISILAYEVPWNNLRFRNEAFVVVSEECCETKLAAIACYKSQSGRPYTKPDYIRAQLRFRGTQIAANYAEAFEVVRWIL